MGIYIITYPGTGKFYDRIDVEAVSLAEAKRTAVSRLGMKRLPVGAVVSAPALAARSI